MENRSEPKSGMERRDVLKLSSAFLGYALTGGAAAAIMNGCKADTSPTWKPSFMNESQFTLLGELVEMIIPATDIPGAKEAMVDRYIDSMLASYPIEERKMFLDGLSLFDTKAQELNGNSFLKSNEDQRKSVFDALIEDSKNSEGPHIWNLVKEGTISGYCRSEIGATQLLNFDPVPGPYQGCIDFSTVGKTHYI